MKYEAVQDGSTWSIVENHDSGFRRQLILSEPQALAVADLLNTHGKPAALITWLEHYLKEFIAVAPGIKTVHATEFLVQHHVNAIIYWLRFIYRIHVRKPRDDR